MLREHLFHKRAAADPLFRWRGGDVSRVEAISDGVFAVTLTLLVATTTIPSTFWELWLLVRDLPVFLVSFAAVFQAWYYHYLFFRRYGLQDLGTIALNGAFLFLILFFAYPLKFLADFLWRMVIGVPDDALFVLPEGVAGSDHWLASELGQREILAITDDEQALAVERLRVVDPTQVLEGRCKSPKGWRDEIFADINKHHEHHAAPTSWKFGLAVYNGQAKVAVLVVGRPVSRLLARAEPQTLEVTRGCSLPVHSDLRANAMSKAYAAAAKTARRAGATKLITYTLEEESGHSLRASGWTPTRVGKGGSWSRKKRQRSECSKGATTGRKVRWEKGLTRATRRDVAARALPPRLTPDAQPR